MGKLIKLWPLVFLVLLAMILHSIWLTHMPEKSILSNSLEAKDVKVSSKVNGRISKVFIKEGDNVKTGQLLLVLEGDEIKAQLEQALTALRKSEAELTDLKKGARPQEIAQAEANTSNIKAKLEQAKSKYENALADYNRMNELHMKEEVSTQTFLQYKTQKEVFENDVSVFEQELIRAKENESLVKEGARKDQIRALEFQVENYKAKVRELEKYNNELVVISPLNGEVSSFNLKMGEVIKAYQALLTITDLSDIYVRVYIPGNKLSLVKLNQNVKIKADSFPNELFDGYVSYIGAQAEYTPRNIQTPEERTKLVYQVKIQITNKENKLRHGMYVTVKL